MKNHLKEPLKICLLSYRSNPHCGGQGVYIKNLSKALCRLGHEVEVVSGLPRRRAALIAKSGLFRP